MFASFVIRWFLLPVLLLSVADLTGIAGTAPPPNLIAPIQQLYDAVQEAMKAGVATPFVRRFGIIAPAIDQAFDLPGNPADRGRHALGLIVIGKQSWVAGSVPLLHPSLRT